MRFSPTKSIHNLLLLTSLLLAACGGGGGGAGGNNTVNPPVAPTGVSATDVTGCYTRIRINWTPATGATSYKIYRSASTGVALTSPIATLVTASPYTDSDPALAVGSRYYYKITAVNAGGESSGSSEASIPLITVTPIGCTNTGGSKQGSALTLTTAVTTLAGIAGFPGTVDGTGTSAQFWAPRGVTTDGTSLYVADTTNHTIRKIVIATGVVTTLAGTAGLTGTTNASGTVARFNGPKGITTDGTNLYVADTGSGSIRQIVISTGAVTTIVPAATFAAPAGITYDGIDLYVADTGNHNISKVTLPGLLVTPFAGTGAAGNVNGTGTTSVRFNAPQGLTSRGGNLYVADTGNSDIRVITISGAIVTTLAGTGVAGFLNHATGTSAQFNFPQGITTDGTNLYVADTANHRIRMIDGTGAVTTIAGDGTGGNVDNATGTSARFYSPSGITTDGTSLFDADTTNNTIRVIH